MNKICDLSIVCANYNNEEFLNDFFKSIIDSTFCASEIIIVDDCSTDNSLFIIKKYENNFKNIKVIKLNKNIGFANALNKAIEYVTCKYILRIDPDDILASDRIEKQYFFMENNKNIDILGSNICYFHGNVNNCSNQSNFPSTHEEILNRYLDGSHGLVHGGVMLKSSLLKDNKYRQSYVPAEEYDIFSRLLSKGFIAHNLDEILTYVRIHDTSVSNNMPFSTVEKTFLLRKEIWNISTNRLYLYKEFLARNIYRKSLNKNGMIKTFLLVLVSILKPKSLIKRIKKYVS